MLKIKNLRQNHSDYALQISLNPYFKHLRKDTITIRLSAKRPRPGTIEKNHIQSSLSFV